MLMLDLDDLKPVNDRFGHQAGDRLLKAVAETIRQTVRFTDAAARYGGDEFVVLLPETDPAGGYVVGEKLRRDIAAVTLHAADRRVRSTVSVGLVTYPDDGTTIEQLVEAADVAMYESKRRGKNRIVGYQTRTERVATAIDVEGGEVLQLSLAQDARTGGDPAPWGAPPSQSEGTEAPSQPRPMDRPTDVPAKAEAVAREATTAAAEAGARQADRTWLTRTDDSRTLPMPPMPGRTLAPDQPGPPGAPPQRPAADLRSGGRSTSRSDEIRDTGERPWISLPIEPWDQPERPSD
jgi:diguanylate cyclase (GGDEF)-like protein